MMSFNNFIYKNNFKAMCIPIIYKSLLHEQVKVVYVHVCTISLIMMWDQGYYKQWLL